MRGRSGHGERFGSFAHPGCIKPILLIVGCLLGMLEVVALPSASKNENGGWDWTASGGTEVKRDAAGLIFNARDYGSASWSFLAPRQLLGDQRAMLGGKLVYRIGFRTSDGEWAGGDAPDIELESAAHNITLIMRGLVPPRAYLATAETTLCASCGWEYGETRSAPSDWDFGRALSSLSEIRIRGGYHTGPEQVFLMSPHLSPPHPSSTPSTTGASSSSGDEIVRGEEGALSLNESHLTWVPFQSTGGKSRVDVPLGKLKFAQAGKEDGLITVEWEGGGGGLAMATCGHIQRYPDVSSVASLFSDARARAKMLQGSKMMGEGGTAGGRDGGAGGGVGERRTTNSKKGSEKQDGGATSRKEHPKGRDGRQSLGEREGPSSIEMAGREEVLVRTETVKGGKSSAQHSKVVDPGKKRAVASEKAARAVRERVKGLPGTVVGKVDGDDASSVVLTNSRLAVVRASESGAVEVNDIALADLTFSRRPGRMVLEGGGGGGGGGGGVAISLDVEAYNFQDLINLIDRAARLLGAN